METKQAKLPEKEEKEEKRAETRLKLLEARINNHSDRINALEEWHRRRNEQF